MVYWGNFSTDQINSFQTWLQGFATYLSGSTAPQGQQPTVGQYGVRGAHVGVFYHDPVIPPSDGGEPQVPYSAPAQELQKLQNTMCGAQPCLPKENGERVYIVLQNGIRIQTGNPPGPGQVLPSNCGDNGPDSAGNFMVITQEMASNPCGNTVAAMEALISNEIQEVITDQTCGGWNQGCSQGQIGDLCSTNVGDAGAGFGPIQTVYDDIQNGQCTDFTPEQLPQISAVAQSTESVQYIDLLALWSDHGVRHQRWVSTAGWLASWNNLGGTFTSPPVVVRGAGGVGTLDVFAQGTDNNFYHQSFNGSSWNSNWDNNAFSGDQFNGQPAVVSRGTNVIDVFGQGTDGNYYHKEWNGSRWLALELVGGPFNGPPTAVSRSSSSVDLFGRWTDGSYKHKSYDGTSYTPSGPGQSGWDSVTPGNQFISEPVVAAGASGLDVFGQKTDWSYYHTSSTDGKTWSTVEPLGNTFNGPPSAAQQPNALDVVGQGTDGHYYHMQKSNGSWGALEAVNGAGFGGGELILSSSNTLNLFVEGTDHHAYFKSLQGTVWSPSGSNWSTVGGTPPNLH
jgi:hypothetical protein